MTRSAAPTICAVLGEHLSNYYTGPIVRGAVAAAAELGYRLILYSALNVHLTRSTLTLEDLPLIPRGADAYLLPAYVTDEVVALCARHDAPIMLYAGSRPGLPSIGPRNRPAAREATEHLIALGRRRIVHLTGLPNSEESEDRHSGYRDALEAAGLPYDEALVARGYFQIEAAEREITQLLRDGVPFDAVFAANDMEALGTLNALARAGLRVPADVAVVGFDDAASAAVARPPLPTVRQPPFQIGWEAVRLLGAAALGEPLPERVVVPSQLIVRASCGGEHAARSRDGGLTARLAERLGEQGPLVSPDAVEAWLAPLRSMLEGRGEVAATLDDLLAGAERRGWNLGALLGHLDALQTGYTARAEPPPARLGAAATTVAALLYARMERWKLARGARVNAINYVIDLLRDISHDQSVEAALRYLVSSGPRTALIAQGGPRDTIMAQRIEALAGVTAWHGPARAYPPADWLVPGETLLLMPLEAGAQQRTLVGVVEREGLEHLDLDDLLLRSINTYRSITVLNDTLHELDAARSVQQSLLPDSAPPTEDYDIAGAARPARQVGGDLYGYYVRPSGALAVAIGDVAGKGMPAALLMSACATALAGTIPAGLAPSLTLSQIHQMLQPSVGHGQNAAVCLVYLDGARVRVANAGAVAPLLRSEDSVRAIEVGGLPLGTPLSGIRPYQEVEERMAPGDLLVLSSDGIVEAMNERGELYGFGRFAQAIASGPADSAAGMLAHILADVSAFVGQADIHDDMALVVARFRG
jgi:LacI family transcriptional regulator